MIFILPILYLVRNTSKHAMEIAKENNGIYVCANNKAKDAYYKAIVEYNIFGLEIINLSDFVTFGRTKDCGRKIYIDITGLENEVQLLYEN